MGGGEVGEGGDGAGDVAEAEPDIDDFFRITSCSSSFGDGAKDECVCGICDDGMGFELKCPNELISVECSDFSGAIDMMEVAGDDAENPGVPGVPGVSVLRLVALQDADAVTADADDTTTAATAAATTATTPTTVDADDTTSAATAAAPATTTPTTAASNKDSEGTDENEDGASPAASYPGAVAASLVMACASFIVFI